MMGWLEGQKQRRNYFPGEPPRYTTLPANASPPLRLLYVATSGGEGGIERCSAQMAQHFCDRGFRLTYACRPQGFLGDLCRSSGVPTWDFSIRNSGDMAAAARLARRIVQDAIDIVHVHSRRDFVPAIAAVALARAGGRRPRLVLHAHLMKPLGVPPALTGRLVARGADAVIAVSDAVRRRLLDAHGLKPRFVRRIYNGVDMDACVPIGARSRVRAHWGLPGDALVVGMVGRLNAKGQEALITVAPSLLARFPYLYFVLLGSDGAAGEGVRLAARARGGGFGDRVLLPGACGNVSEALCGFDAFAHLPDEEAFGMVLIEALAAGVPTVATRVGGCPEIVANGVTGLLVEPGDPTGLVEALTVLLATGSEAHRAVLKSAGRKAVRERFSQAGQMGATEGLYREILCPSPMPLAVE